ncbi:MAG TPA: hydroxysqualene dehydroxylase HpnE [Burkholderiales bacterium]
MAHLGQRVAARVAVVGAGYAGMAAAVALTRAAVPVAVYESGPLPGGRARRVASQGVELDNGQHVLVGAYRTLYGLMREVGVPASALLRMPLEIRYAGGAALRRLPLPGRLGLAAGLLAARGIAWRERWAAMRFLSALRARRFTLERDATVAELLARHRQDGAIGHFLWRPLCVSALNTPPELASARTFLAVLRDTLGAGRGASDLLLPRVDLSRLFPEPAAEFVRRHGGEVRLKETVRDIGALRAAHDAVIVAAAPHQLKTLLPQAPEFSYQPIYTCYLQYGPAARLPLPMLGLAEGIVQWVFDRGALLGERGRFACVISAQGDHQQMQGDELAARCHAELAAHLPALGRPAWSRVIAEKRATITCGVARRSPPLEPLPGVFLAGDYTDPEYPPTLEAAVRSGIRAAQDVLRELRP